MRFLRKLMQIVEVKVKPALPNHIDLVLDGWSCESTHYVAVFASYPANVLMGYENVLLEFSPLENETFQDAAEHADFLDFVLRLFGKTEQNISIIIGHNANANRALAREFEKIFTDCHSHLLNLAFHTFLQMHSPVINEVQALLKQLSCNFPAALLRQETFPAARCCIKKR